MHFSAVLATCVVSVVAQIDLYEYGTNATASTSDGCTAALKESLNCEPYLLTLSMSDYYGPVGNGSFQDQLCSEGCGAALATYHSSVAQQCAEDVEPWDGVPAVWAGDVLWATWNRTCLRDPNTNKYCTGACPNLYIMLQ